MFRHDTRKFDSDYEKTIDPDGNTVRRSDTPKELPNIAKVMKELLVWAEKRRGSKFSNIPKQYRAMKMMRLAGIKPKDIQDRWQDMEGDKFWESKGFDFTTVASSFDRKPL